MSTNPSQNDSSNAPGDVFSWTRDWALHSRRLKLWAAEETGSTNTVAKNDSDPSTTPWLGDDAYWVSEPSLYLARKQNQGRGRGSNVWVTPPGNALLSSWSFSVARVPQPILAPLVGLALFEAARDSWPEIAFNLKAPNDLYIGDKKTAGLLIETVDFGAHKRCVVGLGLNVLCSPGEVTTSTCLASHARENVTSETWQAFLDRWLHALQSAVHAGQREQLDSSAAERMKSALNLHPLLKEPILEVDPYGQLRTPTRLIAWHEL